LCLATGGCATEAAEKFLAGAVFCGFSPTTRSLLSVSVMKQQDPFHPGLGVG
jgi:hypothetical protein